MTGGGFGGCTVTLLKKVCLKIIDYLEYKLQKVTFVYSCTKFYLQTFFIYVKKNFAL